MELNKWYVINDETKDDFISEAPEVNRAIVDYIGDRAFKVAAVNQGSNEIILGVHAIHFYGDTKSITREEALPRYRCYGQQWIYEEEFKYFTEYKLPEHAKFHEAEAKRDYIIHVSGLEPTEYGGGTGYIVGCDSSPQRFTLEEAKEHSLFVLDGAKTSVVVNIFRLETTASIVSEIKFS